MDNTQELKKAVEMIEHVSRMLASNDPSTTILDAAVSLMQAVVSKRTQEGI